MKLDQLLRTGTDYPVFPSHKLVSFMMPRPSFLSSQKGLRDYTVPVGSWNEDLQSEKYFLSL